MQIDWVTVAAQIVNFLVLVWLLQRFLYGPITRAMQRREQRIEDRLAEAKHKQRQAEDEAKTLQRKKADLEERQEAIMDEARQKAKALRDDLEQKARDEVEQQRRTWRHQVIDEKKEFLGELRTRTARHVYELARSALADLADADLEAKVAARFADRLKSLERDRTLKIANALTTSGDDVLIESSFELSPAAKGQITKILHEVIADDLNVTYALADGLPVGIRLRAGGQTVEWSLARYLERLEGEVEAKLAEVGSSKEQEAA